MSHSQSGTVGKPKKMKLRLPAVEPDGRVCFFGFAVTKEWLVDYAETHWDNAGQFDDFAKISTAIHLLKRESSIKSLELEAALVDPKVPSETAIQPGHRTGELMVPLLAICSNEKPSYNKRPSQVNVDLLSRIMGGKQPRWWVDYEDPRSYEC